MTQPNTSEKKIREVLHSTTNTELLATLTLLKRYAEQIEATLKARGVDIRDIKY